MRTEAGDSEGPTGTERVWPADDDGPALTIAQLSRELGVSFRTLRFYESRGFIAPRRAGPARLYRKSDRERLGIILKAKQLGFTLREIADLLALSDASAQGAPGSGLQLSRQQCTEQINFLERQKRDIENALAELRRAYSSHYLSAIKLGDAD